MSGDEQSGPEQLRERELAEERTARGAAAEAGSEQEARASLRRADKARYLGEQLERQTQADRDARHADDDG